jgi:hypothetical protein
MLSHKKPNLSVKMPNYLIKNKMKNIATRFSDFLKMIIEKRYLKYFGFQDVYDVQKATFERIYVRVVRSTNPRVRHLSSRLSPRLGEACLS